MIGYVVEKRVAIRTRDPMFKITLFLMAKSRTIADQKLKIACVRLIDIGIIDLINDSVAQRKPESGAGGIRCS
jgi:hypothetical protein